MNSDSIEITQDQFNEVIPTALRPYIHVASMPLPPTFNVLVDAFQIAVSSLANKVRVVRPLEVIIGKAPFDVHLGNGNLRYTPRNDQVINAHIDHRIVFLDAEKVGRYQKELQVACILEEFAHAIMNISDEQLVSAVVALLYPGVVVLDGKYHPAVQ